MRPTSSLSFALLCLLSACGPAGTTSGGNLDATSNPDATGDTAGDTTPSPVDPTFQAECEVQCRLDAESSECVAPANCVPDCVATTSGLETQCGKCVVLQTEVEPNDDGTCSADVGTIQTSYCSDECHSGTHAARPDFSAECEVQCRTQAGYSGCAAVPASCVPDCVANTLGLETQCGKCVVLQTEVDPNDDGSCGADVGNVGTSYCADSCLGVSHTPRPDFRAECEVQCRIQAGYSGCAQVPANCIDDCVAMTSGLDTLCGKCVVLQTEVDNNGDGTCSAQPGTIETSYCAEECK